MQELAVSLLLLVPVLISLLPYLVCLHTYINTYIHMCLCTCGHLQHGCTQVSRVKDSSALQLNRVDFPPSSAELDERHTQVTACNTYSYIGCQSWIRVSCTSLHSCLLTLRHTFTHGRIPSNHSTLPASSMSSQYTYVSILSQYISFV